ncbi:MAG TPA: PqqD family protein [Clostridiales bacterium]|nr:PqqD family protein [Clostridiales bacterium]
MNDRVLLLIPKKKQSRFSENIYNGCVEIIVPRDGLIDRMVRLFYKTPEVMHIHLDDRGSFVWQAIDGSRTIRDIGTMVEAEFGERAAPLYERLIIFLYTLKKNGFITLSRPECIPGKNTG